jgi:RNA-directed DNA polymerase
VKEIQLELGFEDKRSLFEMILDTYNLKTAFKQVKKNKGAPGIDGITIEEFEQNLEEELNQLRQKVQSWSYKPRFG